MAKEQAFLANGSPAEGISFYRNEFVDNPEYLMGAAHVWVWRRADQGLEVMLQKRSMTKSSHPGKWDISAAGHIDEGELPAETAIREFREELGSEPDPDRLRFAFSIRRDGPGRIHNVFIYESPVDFEPVIDSDEVDEVSWVGFEEFTIWSKDPLKYNLVDHGEVYFSSLLYQLGGI